MGTTLTGSTVASTYPGYIKTGDNGLLSTPKVLSDGVGNDTALTLAPASGASSFSGTLTSLGNFTVGSSAFVVTASNGNLAIATNRFTVAGATGNTAIAGTLNVTGACVFSSTGNFSGNLSTSQTLTCRGLVQNDGAATSTFAGAVTVAGATTFNGSVQFNSLLTFASAASFNAGLTSTTIAATTSSSLATATASSMAVSSFVTVGTTLSVTGNATFSGNVVVSGNISGNGNVTIGDAAADTLTLNAQTITAPNLATITVDPVNDKVVVQDASDSNKLKLVAFQTSPIKKCAISSNSHSYSPAFASANTWSFIQSSSGTDWSVSFAPTTNGNTLVVDVEVNVHIAYNLNDCVAIGLFVDGASVPSSVSFDNPYPYTSSASGGRNATFRCRHSMISSLATHAFKIGVIRRLGNVSDLTINNQSPFTSAEVGTPKSSVFITEFQ